MGAAARRCGLGGRCERLTAALAAQDRAATEASLGDLDIEQLAHIKVTSVSRRPGTVSEAAAAVFVISADDIRRSGATSIPEALRLAPGLDVVRLGAQNWSVTARGFADFTTNKLLVLIDGRAVYSPLFSGVFWESQMLPVDDIERIEVILGPGATLWGSNAVNGVINVVTRSAAASRGGLVAVRTGTAQHFNGSARYGVDLGTRGALRVYGSYVDREPIELADGTDAEDSWQDGQGGFRLDYSGSSRDRLTVQGDLYTASSQQIGREALPTPPFARSVLGDNDLGGGNVLGRWTRQLGEASELQVQAYYDRSVRDVPVAVGRVSVDIADLELLHWFRLGHRHTVVWGAGYQLQNGRLDGTFTTALVPAERTTALLTAYAQDEIALAPERWFLVVGAKLEHNSFTGLEVQPNVRLRWVPRSGHTIWSAVSRAVRIPSRLDTDVQFIAGALPTTPPTFIRIDGNEDFDSEELIAAELGYHGDLTPELSLDVSAYYGWYDKLRSVTTQAPVVEDGQPVLPNLFTNEARGHSAGGTIAANWRALPALRLRASYTRLDMGISLADDAPAGTVANETAGSSPKDQATFAAFATFPHQIEAGVTGRYMSRLSNPTVNGYVETDARLAWAALPSLTLAIVGQDLLHRRHPEFGSRGEIPRSVGLHVTWGF